MVGFDALPEDCLARIISLTTPRDACRVSAVSRAFRSASDSDVVWLRFLPTDLDQIVSASVPSPPIGPSVSRKKDVFFGLCSFPVLIDNDRKSIALEKENGKKCVMMGARGLSIIWGDDLRYWNWSSQHVSRFPEVAELLRVCWFEVRARIEMQLLSARTRYSAYFVFKFVEGNYGLRNQYFEVSIFPDPGGDLRSVCLDPDGRYRHGEIPQDRGDGWKVVSLGEFFVDGPADGEVEIGMKNVTSHWKSGLVIQGIELRPAVP